MRTVQQALPIAIGLTLAVAAAVTLRAELAPFASSGTTARSRVEAAEGRSLAVGISSYSQDLTLDECLKVLSDPISRLDPAAAVRNRGETCIRTASAILRDAPAHAYAAFVSAYAHALIGDATLAADDMNRSRRLAPNEGWLAQLRLRPVREGLLPIGTVRDAVAEDVRLLGMTYRGRLWLADWYRQSRDAQDVILGAIETLPVENQQAFLAAVQAAPA